MTTEAASQARRRALHLQQLAVLWVAALVGLGLAWLVTGIPLDGSAELEAARELGIVSPTILMGYAKSQDLVEFAAVVGLPVVCALGAWLGWRWSRRRELGSPAMELDVAPAWTRVRWLSAGLLMGCAVFISFDLAYFFRPGYNPFVGAWPFLGEEGEMLEWAQRALDGQVYGLDYFCLYGPLMIYGLAGSLALFGDSVVVERVYTYALNLLGYAIVVCFLCRNLRSLVVAFASGLVYFICFNNLLFPSPNTTVLRALLGIAPLLLLAGSGREGGSRHWAGAGLLCGASLLFSQEAGLCALVAVVGISVLDLAGGSRAARVGWRAAAFAVGLLALLIPYLAYLASQDALGSFFESLYGYPRLMTLGFGAAPFPSFRDFVAGPLESGAILEYAMLLAYVVSVLAVATAFLRGDRSRRLRLLFALTLFGLLLFRVALGRSSSGSTLKVAHPAFLLCFLHIDGGVSAMRAGGPRFWRWLGGARFAAWTGCLALVVALAPGLQVMIANATPGLRDPSRKLSIGDDGEWVPELSRAGVRMDADTAATARAVKDFLDASSAPGDYVYFFPNEAIYYFLFDRRNPTRYAISYFAITSEQRRELVADLERRRPRFVVWSMRTWRVDSILENVQVPEVFIYLREHYRLHSMLEGAVILERLES